MDLLFRLSTEDKDLKNPEYFFSNTLPSRDDNYFFDSRRNKQLENGNSIYFSYKNIIVATAIFSGEIIEKKERDDKFKYGHKLKNILIVNTNKELNYDIVSTRTTYINTKEKKQEIDRILNSIMSIHPDEINENEHVFEGAKKRIAVNRYERNNDARDKCINEYSHKCFVCKFDFSEIYGEVGEQFIHVHHLKPLHEIQKEYKLDPIKDLRPVCPNCHAMLHRRKPPYSIEEMIKSIEKNCPQYLNLFNVK